MRVSAATRVTAFHEAGHVVAAWRTGLKHKTATIVPTTYAAGSAETRPVRGIVLGIVTSARSRVHMENHLTVLLAGPAAQRRRNPQSGWRESGGSDYHSAYELASELSAGWIGCYRVDNNEAPRACLRLFEIVAREMIDKNWPHVEAVASALIEKGTLSSKEIADVIEASKASAMAGWRKRAE